MTQPRHAAVSARARLRARARARGEDVQRVLVRYALERLLYRLSVSEHAGDFILKGAMLFALWGDGLEHRPTKDIDLLGRGDPRPSRLAVVFQSVCGVKVAADDGLDFHADSVVGAAIREDAVYDGVRVVLQAFLGRARIRVQIDIGYGDAVTPSPVRVLYPTLLDDPAPALRAYPAPTVMAEKLEAMVSLGIANSRMKDFFDVAWCAAHLAFEGEELVSAVRATFERRGTELPIGAPLAFTSSFATDAAKRDQWAAFARKSQLGDPGALPEVIEAVSALLLPVLQHASIGGYPGRWSPGGPWVAHSLAKEP